MPKFLRAHFRRCPEWCVVLVQRWSWSIRHAGLSGQTLLLLVRTNCRHGAANPVKGTVVEDIVEGVSQHLIRNLSTQHSVQGLEAMAQSIR